MNRVKLLSAALCASLVFLLSGCAAGGTNGKTPDPAQITARIQKEIKFGDMHDIPADELKKFYTIPDGALQKSSVFISSMSSSDEVAVFVAPDAAKTDSLKKAVDARIEQKTTDFKNYNPEQYSKVEKNVVEVRGNYVFFVVCGDSGKAKNIFDGYFK